MTDTATAPTFKPKKSVALSGTAAGNTALCTVGRSGNDLHYRGYDILDVATTCEFEEIAHLLVHGKLPTEAELRGYKAKLKALRGLPAGVKAALEQLPPSAHPMDVMRTGVSVLGCLSPEKDDHNHPGARDIADKLMADVEDLAARIDGLTFPPQVVVGGAAVLMDEVAATKISGEEDRYSHTDLWDFRGNFDGARKIVELFRPHVKDDAFLATIDANFDKVDRTLEKYREGEGYQSYEKLTDDDRRVLAAGVNTLAEDLSTDDLSGLLWPLYGALIANLQVLIDVVDDVATAEPVRT